MFNRRLNLFDGYSPIENNVSRIFARILQDNQYAFDEFIQLIKNKALNIIGSNGLFADVNNSFDVSFQKPIQDIKSEVLNNQYDYIIGIALTPIEQYSGISKSNSNSNSANDINNDSRANGITDIVIENYSNTYILIECKTVNDPAKIQVNDYLDQITKDKKNITKIQLDISWTDIIDILERYQQQRSRQDLIIDEYLIWLRRKYIQWFPAKAISIQLSEKEIEKRMKVAVSKTLDIINYNNSCHFIDLNKENAILQTDISYATRMWFVVRENQINLEVCIADTKGQMGVLLKRRPNFTFLSIPSKPGEYDVEIMNYIKIADSWGGGIGSENISLVDRVKFGNYYNNCCGNFPVSDIDNQNNNWSSDIKVAVSNILINTGIKNSNISKVNISCGYKLIIKFDMNHLEQIDRGFKYYSNTTNDNLTLYFRQIIDYIYNFI